MTWKWLLNWNLRWNAKDKVTVKISEGKAVVNLLEGLAKISVPDEWKKAMIVTCIKALEYYKYNK